MSFSDEQKAALTAKLHPSSVKKNPKGFDYIEAWHAIAEMNRIFGHDGWDREMVRCEPCGEAYQTDSKNGPVWRVAYWATVRIRVHAGDKVVVRDGTGYGSGIGKDLNDCHEGAVKEAESDAMKRALMTLGNPFGLALYDKAKAGVGDDTKLPKSKLQQAVRDLVTAINKSQGEDELDALTSDPANAAVARQAKDDIPDFWETIGVALDARRAHFDALREADNADVNLPVAGDLPQDYFDLIDELEALVTKEELRQWCLNTTARRASLPREAQGKLRELTIERQNDIKRSAELAALPHANGASIISAG